MEGANVTYPCACCSRNSRIPMAKPRSGDVTFCRYEARVEGKNDSPQTSWQYCLDRRSSAFGCNRAYNLKKESHPAKTQLTNKELNLSDVVILDCITYCIRPFFPPLIDFNSCRLHEASRACTKARIIGADIILNGYMQYTSQRAPTSSLCSRIPKTKLTNIFYIDSIRGTSEGNICDPRRNVRG